MIKTIIIAFFCLGLIGCEPAVDANGCLPNTTQGDDMCATAKVGTPEQAKEFCARYPASEQCK
jgi:hypothetical protein